MADPHVPLSPSVLSVPGDSPGELRVRVEGERGAARRSTASLASGATMVYQGLPKPKSKSIRNSDLAAAEDSACVYGCGTSGPRMLGPRRSAV